MGANEWIVFMFYTFGEIEQMEKNCINTKSKNINKLWC